MVLADVEDTRNSSSRSTLWAAVLRRDEDAGFVYGVRSTHIYCRPACPSRRPRPSGVQFFQTPQRAEEAGYRACLRCRPESAATDPGTALVLDACRTIEDDPRAAVTLAALGQHLGVSPWHLQRTFKARIGITPRQYADACRLQHFKSQIRAGESITGALYEAGYGSSSRLYERTATLLGMTPSRYKRGGEGKAIRYTIVQTTLGRLLVGATSEGVCAVSLGEDDDTLTNLLNVEYHAATIERDDSTLQPWAAMLARHLAGEQPHLDLPIDVRATAFQRRVWEYLQTIPYGETRTYTAIARELGTPSGARAVAGACAANPVALIVPCHRVVREDGTLGGYRWGLDRKRQLLEGEKSETGALAEERVPAVLCSGHADRD